ncbi:hypothetical protein J1G36_13215, partial [Pseudomonas carnis]|nr:hypothetical protein [Pseudomonas carnis]
DQKQIKIKGGSLRIVVTVCRYSPKSCVDTYGYRGQASSHKGHALPTESASGKDPLWERACPRKR